MKRDDPAVGSTILESSGAEARALAFDALTSDQQCVCEIQDWVTDIAPNSYRLTTEARQMVSVSLSVGFTREAR